MQAPVKVVFPGSTERLIDVILAFVDVYNSVAKIDLYSYQKLFLRRICRSLLEPDGATITGLWSRQSGKSEAISSLAGALAILLPTLARAFPDDQRLDRFATGIYIGVFAPRMQLASVIFGRVRERAEKDASKVIYADPDFNLKVTASRGDTVAWSNGSSVSALTASEQSFIEGKTFHLIIIDEAQKVSRTKVEKEIVPMAAHTNGTLVKIGTANVSYGGFRDSIEFNLEKEKSTGVRNHFEIPYDMAIDSRRQKYRETGIERHLDYEKWVAGQLDKLGGNVDNDEFAMNFRLLWRDVSIGAVDMKAFSASADLEREANVPKRTGTIVAALDLGRINDASVLTVGEVETPDETYANVDIMEGGVVFCHKHILGWLAPKGMWHEQLDEIVRYLDRYAVQILLVDGTGVGDPIAEQLRMMLPGIRVISFKMSTSANDTVFRNYLAELEAGRFTYPAGEVTRQSPEYEAFVIQHRMLTKELTRGTYLKCCAPEGEHDDYPVSSALFCWAATMVDGTEVVAKDVPSYSMRQRPGRGGGGDRADRYRSRY